MCDNDARRAESTLARLEAQGIVRRVTVRMVVTASMYLDRLSDVHELSPSDILQAGNYEIEEVW